MNHIHHLLCGVLESRALGGAHHRLTLHAPQIAAAARPGQFLHCAPAFPQEAVPLLRRPLSISGVSAMQPSASPDVVELLFRVLGRGTHRLASRQPGEDVDCLGPLGNGFTVVPERAALLIAGGMGIAPLHWLAMDLAARGCEVHLLAGAKSAADFPCQVVWQQGRARLPDLEAVGVDTEFVSEEDGLLATDLTARRLPEFLSANQKIQAYAVGPRAMLKALADLLPADLPCQVSLEERMACGIGACRSCVVALRRPEPPGYLYRRVCRDGPVFDIRDVIWEREAELD